MRSKEKVKVPENLLSFLKEKDTFFIATHINPDGDAFGSALALSMALETLGKHTVVYERDSVPAFYRFLPGHERIINSISNLKSQISNLILLDCNTPERAGIEGTKFEYSAVIDHHETEKDFGDIKWVEIDAAATGLMLFYLIKALGIPITKEIAINLYCAIAIDTGTFRYNNTTAEVLQVSAELIEAGANPADISHNLYETWSRGRFALLIAALNTLEIRYDVAIILVTKEMYQKTGAEPADTENFPNFPQMMKDIKVSALFRELDNNYWKVSLRSKGDMNVAKIAALFDGGGHENAAGYSIRADLKTAQETLLQAIPQKTTA